jgi:hypothetical protein
MRIKHNLLNYGTCEYKHCPTDLRKEPYFTLLHYKLISIAKKVHGSSYECRDWVHLLSHPQTSQAHDNHLYISPDNA